MWTCNICGRVFIKTKQPHSCKKVPFESHFKNKELAKKYLETAWNALKYLVDDHAETVFVGVGIPYNKDLISLEEIEKMGEKIRKINEQVQVCVLDYRPAFRRMHIRRPEYEEMVNVWKILNGTGLKTVICQTIKGQIGPEL